MSNTPHASSTGDSPDSPNTEEQVRSLEPAEDDIEVDSTSTSNDDLIAPRRVIYRQERELFPVLLIAMLLTTMVCLLPMIISLGASDTRRTMEKITLLSSSETWRNVYAEKPGAWMIPKWNGRDRVNKPPLTVWMNIIAWWDLNPDTVSPERLIWRSRLMTLFMVWVALASVFWAGKSLGDIRVAVLATMITGTMVFFVKQSQLATYDTMLVGWVTLSIAAGLWAMRPIKPMNWNSRIILGWSICGIALGAGMLTKGPLTIPLVMIPLVMSAIISPNRRFSNIIGMMFAVIVGILLAAPWYIYVLETVPAAMSKLGGEWSAKRQEYQGPQVYLFLILWGTCPWILWVLSALFQPFIRAGGARRKQLMIAWLWFLAILVMFMIPGAKAVRYLLPLFPVMGLLAAQVWSEHARLSDEGRSDPGVNLLRIPHWVGLIGASILLPVFIFSQNILIGWNWFDTPIFTGLHPVLVILSSIAMLGLAVGGAVLHFKWRPTHAAIATAIWAVILNSVIWAGYHQSEKGVNPVKEQAYKLVSIVEPRERVAFLYTRDLDRMLNPVYQHLKAEELADIPEADRYYRHPSNLEPNEEFLFYTQRTIGHVDFNHLSLGDRPKVILVREPTDENLKREYWQRLQAYGYQYQFDLDDGHHPKHPQVEKGPSAFKNIAVFSTGTPTQ